jgi:hypothetical protein
MRELIKEFVKAVSESMPILEPIYEFGSFQTEGQEVWADLRPLFPGKKYIGCDMRWGKGVDLILNLHDIELPDSTAGTVLMLDTLEHVEFCRKAMSEVYRILKPGGVAIISSVMYFPIHEYPSDYWRFTPEGFRSLLNQFSYSTVDFLGEEDSPHTVVGIGIKEKNVSTAEAQLISNKINDWKISVTPPHQEPGDPNPTKEFLKLFIPPILLQTYRKFKNGSVS